MNTCKEFALDDLTAITAIPIANITASSTSSHVNNLTPTIAKADFYPSLTNAITIGHILLNLTQSGGTPNVSSYLVPIRRDTGKAKDDTSDKVAGRLHTVSVNCEIDERGGEIWAPITALTGTPPCSLRLERTPHHLVLSFRDGAMGFVAASEDTYQCTIERDGSKVSAAFRIQNLMGIQLLV